MNQPLQPLNLPLPNYIIISSVSDILIRKGLRKVWGGGGVGGGGAGGAGGGKGGGGGGRNSGVQTLPLSPGSLNYSIL